jgi:hypothetical protein
MRKLFWAVAISMALIAPALYAEEISYPSDESALRVPSPEEGDSCRQECAEEDADPDECQLDCNTVT